MRAGIFACYSHWHIPETWLRHSGNTGIEWLRRNTSLNLHRIFCNSAKNKLGTFWSFLQCQRKVNRILKWANTKQLEPWPGVVHEFVIHPPPASLPAAGRLSLTFSARAKTSPSVTGSTGHPSFNEDKKKILWVKSLRAPSRERAGAGLRRPCSSDWG